MGMKLDRIGTYRQSIACLDMLENGQNGFWMRRREGGGEGEGRVGIRAGELG
jgi:hypothetical protein